jgi:hypothetical protein
MGVATTRRRGNFGAATTFAVMMGGVDGEQLLLHFRLQIVDGLTNFNRHD